MGFENQQESSTEVETVFSESIDVWGDKETETFLKRRLSDLGARYENTASVMYEKTIIIRLLDNGTINPEKLFAELKLVNIDKELDVSEFNEVCELVSKYVSDTEGRNGLATTYSEETTKNRLGSLNADTIQLYKDNEIPLEIKRSSGDIEGGWTIEDINENGITVLSSDGVSQKLVQIDDLIELNP